MARIVGGVIGWLAGTVLLVVTNIVSGETLLNQQQSVMWGAIALLVGIALGGVAAGFFGARAEGITGAGISGGLAAVLYLATLLGLMVGASRLGTAPEFITIHPIRATLAIVFLASLLALLALAVGALVSRYVDAPEYALASRAPQPSAPAGARGLAPRSQPARHAPMAPNGQRGPQTNQRGPYMNAPSGDRPPTARGYAERPPTPPTGPYRPEQRNRPPSAPAPRSVPMPPPEQWNPPRR